MSEILKMFELAQKDRVSEVEIGRGRIEAGLHPQRFAPRRAIAPTLRATRILDISAAPFLM